jgi:HEAT repeat protein
MVVVAASALAVWFTLVGAPSIWTLYLLRDIQSGGITAPKSAKLLLATRGSQSVPALREALIARQFSSRRIAADSLGALGPDAVDAVPDLNKAIYDVDPGVRVSAVIALGRIGPGARSAVPALSSIAGSKENRLQSAAKYALRQIGPERRPAVPASRRAPPVS